MINTVISSVLSSMWNTENVYNKSKRTLRVVKRTAAGHLLHSSDSSSQNNMFILIFCFIHPFGTFIANFLTLDKYIICMSTKHYMKQLINT